MSRIQAVARFSLEKLEGGEATRTECETRRSIFAFCASRTILLTLFYQHHRLRKAKCESSPLLITAEYNTCQSWIF